MPKRGPVHKVDFVGLAVAIVSAAADGPERPGVIQDQVYADGIMIAGDHRARTDHAHPGMTDNAGKIIEHRGGERQADHPSGLEHVAGFRFGRSRRYRSFAGDACGCSSGTAGLRRRPHRAEYRSCGDGDPFLYVPIL